MFHPDDASKIVIFNILSVKLGILLCQNKQLLNNFSSKRLLMNPARVRTSETNFDFSR